MPLKTPAFWYRTKLSWQAILLAPFAGLYALGRALHCVFTRPQRAQDVHVICLGNANAGGSGKTPSALAVMALLRAHQLAKAPAFLLRGYGGAITAPTQVDPARHSAADVGDEALMLARHAPVYIARDRLAGARFAAQAGVDVLVMDDGLQNRSLQPDTAFMVVDAQMGVGNGLLLPAGPLREPLSCAIKRSDAVILIGSGEEGAPDFWPASKPCFAAALSVAEDFTLDDSAAYLAVTGIAYPDKFFKYLKDNLQLDLQACLPFADHHNFTQSDVQVILDKALELNCKVITTQKDFVKMQALPLDLSAVIALPVELRFAPAQEEALATFLQARLTPEKERVS